MKGLFYMDWVDQELKNRRGKRFIDLYARMMVTYGKVDLRLLGLVYRHDQSIPEATAKRLLKQEKIIMACNQRIVELLEDKGVTKEYLVQLRKDVADKALEDGKYDSVLKAIEKFEQLQELEPEQIKTTDEIQLSSISKNLQDGLEESKQAQLKRTTNKTVLPQDTESNHTTTQETNQDNQDKQT